MKAQRALTLCWRTQGLGALAGLPPQLGLLGYGCGNSVICVLDPDRSSGTAPDAVSLICKHISTPARVSTFATSPWIHLALCRATGMSGRAATATATGPGVAARLEAALHQHRSCQGMLPLGVRPLCTAAAAASKSSRSSAAAAATHAAAAAAAPPTTAAVDTLAPTTAPEVVKDHGGDTSLGRDSAGHRSSAVSKRDKDADPRSVMMRLLRTTTVGVRRSAPAPCVMCVDSRQLVFGL